MARFLAALVFASSLLLAVTVIEELTINLAVTTLICGSE